MADDDHWESHSDEFTILPQPDDVSCGPTCLHAVYQHFGDQRPLSEVLSGVERLWHGGTLAVNLARHALGNGYRATIYTYNLWMFDPEWFEAPEQIPELLARQAALKPELAERTDAYLDFLDQGGELRFETLNSHLIRKHLRRGLPLLTGLSATYLYQTARERPDDNEPDPIAGEPAGHFVVIYGMAPGGEVRVADPYQDNPMDEDLYYHVAIERAIGAVLLGVMTHDANLLVLEPA